MIYRTLGRLERLHVNENTTGHTHTLIWFLEDNPKLSLKAKSLIEDLSNRVYVHAVSWFEISIKIKIGKLTPPDPIEIVFIKASENQIETLAMKPHQLTVCQNLPLFEMHRDPFDNCNCLT